MAAFHPEADIRLNFPKRSANDPKRTSQVESISGDLFSGEADELGSDWSDWRNDWGGRTSGGRQQKELIFWARSNRTNGRAATRIRFSSSFSVNEVAFVAGQATEVGPISTRESTHVCEAPVHCDVGDCETLPSPIQQRVACLVQTRGLDISVRSKS